MSNHSPMQNQRDVEKQAKKKNNFTYNARAAIFNRIDFLMENNAYLLPIESQFFLPIIHHRLPKILQTYWKFLLILEFTKRFKLISLINCRKNSENFVCVNQTFEYMVTICCSTIHYRFLYGLNRKQIRTTALYVGN